MCRLFGIIEDLPDQITRTALDLSIYLSDIFADDPHAQQGDFSQQPDGAGQKCPSIYGQPHAFADDAVGYGRDADEKEDGADQADQTDRSDAE